jgi:hypothetical protein
MTSSAVPWRISAVWISLTLLTFLAIDPSSFRNWVLVTTMAVVPSLVLLRLWSDGPPQTVAEVLHATEGRR